MGIRAGDSVMEYLPCTFKALSSFPAPQEKEEKSKLLEELRYGCNVPAKGYIPGLH